MSEMKKLFECIQNGIKAINTKYGKSGYSRFFNCKLL
jgi:hypothetical protein